MKLSPLNLAWTAFVGNIIVILQGAFVRATGSGAGCGRHWPTCNGEIIPLGHSLETTIEFSHRLLSTVILLLGIWLFIVAFKKRREKQGFFVFATAALGFLIVEALLGGATVLLELTGENTSIARGVMVASHLVNSLLLVGTLALTVVYAREQNPWPLGLKKQGTLTTVLLLGLVGMLFLMFSGGIAAMGNTMFPASSLQEGIAADFSPDSHPFIRLRILHPLIAIVVGVYLLLSLGLSWWLKPVQAARGVAKALLSIYLLQVLIGVVNLAFLAPIVLQILHLAVAVVAFALLTTLGAYLLGDPNPKQTLATLPAQPQGGPV